MKEGSWRKEGRIGQATRSFQNGVRREGLWNHLFLMKLPLLRPELVVGGPAVRCGFKRHVQAFQILSSKACAHFDVRPFWRALARQNKKVLTEKCIIDSISSGDAGYRALGVHTTNDIKSWKTNLERQCHTLRQRTDAHGGNVVAIVLDQHDHLVNKDNMSNDDSGEEISEIIALLGGADGIDHESEASILKITRNYADHILQLALPGGPMHSYEALS